MKHNCVCVCVRHRWGSRGGGEKTQLLEVLEEGGDKGKVKGLNPRVKFLSTKSTPNHHKKILHIYLSTGKVLPFF